MCLGIPGRVVDLLADHDQLATVDIAGVRRRVNVGLLDEGDLAVGDWVLVHVGFALSTIDEAEAERALAALRSTGEAFEDEIAEIAAAAESGTG